MIRRIATAAAAALLAAVPLAAQTAPSRPPTLVVLVVVDQLRPDYFTRYQDQLQGGLARLWRGGAVFTDAHQDHGVTETAPGHASTLSGRFPRSTGIVQNVAGVQDPQAPLVGGGGPSTTGASPFRFRGSTLTDWMRIRDPRSRALSVSRKDRGAILPLGRAHQQAYWYAYDGRFTTSTYYADTLPDWVRRFNADSAAFRLAGTTWDLLLPASAYPEPDTVEAESRSPIERGRHEPAFPHRVPANPDSAARYAPEFPAMDRMIAGLALAGVRTMRLGAGPQTDLLSVSFSTTDAVGHRFGPDSREIHDQVLRLDRTLGAFLDSLYAAVPDSSRVVVALTADHGAASLPEVRPGGAEAAAYHVVLDSLLVPLRRRLAAAGGDTTAVAFDDGLLFVDRAAYARAGLDPNSATAAFVAAARRHPGVLRADPRSALARADTANDAVARRWLHMLPPDLPVAAVVTLRPGRVWGLSRYTQHGSPHGYDTHVPLIFYGAPFRPGRYSSFARVVDIAPTLAHVLGVPPTEPLDGRVLSAALR